MTSPENSIHLDPKSFNTESYLKLQSHIQKCLSDLQNQLKEHGSSESLLKLIRGYMALNNVAIEISTRSDR
jgi:hypothetical protein